MKIFIFLIVTAISMASFANSASDMAAILKSKNFNSLIAIAEKSNFELLSIESQQVRSGMTPKCPCAIYSITLRHKQAMMFAEGDSFDQRQESVKNSDLEIQLLISTFDQSVSFQGNQDEGSLENLSIQLQMIDKTFKKKNNQADSK